MPEMPRWRRQRIYSGPPGERTICVVGDVSGNGVEDIVIASRGPRAELFWLGRAADGSWQRHVIAEGQPLAAGGALADINGNGRLDFVAGTPASDNGVFWWENPPDATQPWIGREIFRMPGPMSHDQLVADVDGDGRPEVYFWNQLGDTLFCAPVPRDPTVSPWPDVQVVARGLREEGPRCCRPGWRRASGARGRAVLVSFSSKSRRNLAALSLRRRIPVAARGRR